MPSVPSVPTNRTPALHAALSSAGRAVPVAKAVYLSPL